MFRMLRWISLALCALPMLLSAQGTVTVTDASIAVGQTVNWTANNTYILDGLVFVDSAATLNIEAGTVIKGKLTPTTGDNTSALIVARYGRINAVGTPSSPIIFTAESDDVANPNDLGVDDRGLWGGVILLGNAKINTTSGVGQIEGIPSNEPRGAYGGTNDDDNSGTLRYISIRHGGSEIGAGNEINGLTMGAVGRGTTVEYIEVISNLDDGYEWFGGTVNSKYLVAAFCADDAFDYDEGWTGKNQFWFVIQGADFAGRIGEHDGGTTPEDGLPFAIPLIRNVTYIGPGSGAAPQGDGGEAIIFRDNAGGKYYNSIITEYNGGVNGRALFVEDLTSGVDSRERIEMGDLVLNNNIWWNFGLGNDVNTIVPQDFVRTHFNSNNNSLVDPQLTSISRTTNGMLDPRPNAAGPAATGATAPSDPYFTTTAYYGAFAPGGSLWTNGWTALYQYGFTPTSNVITVTDADIAPGETVTWTSDNVYVLDGLVFVDSAATLNIEAGTVVKGKLTPTTGDNTSALIVARHGKIFANGTSSSPIIFTAESDDVSDPNDLGVDDRGLWGGVILLGNAKINTTSGVGQIEGIPSNEPRGAYGGSNDDDNSGVLRYVSIRHGGSEIGAGNEINGLTMGAVGRGTTIEYIEVLSNLDDGYEWFGGTVNTKYLIAAFCADDGFDYDEGWTGKNQFWFAIQGTDFAGRIGEHDGGTTPEDGLPFAIPTIFNVTYIGPGTTAAPQGDGGEAIIFRDNAGGRYYNSIITEYNGGVNGRALFVEDLTSGADSRERIETGDLMLNTNIWWNFGLGNDINLIVPQDFVRTPFTNGNNQIVDPQLTSISRTANGMLDPRPNAAGPAGSGAMASADPFFAETSYLGAFAPGSSLWTNGWTALSQYGFTPTLTAGEITVKDADIPPGATVTWTSNNTYILDGLVFVDSASVLNIEAGTVIKAKLTPSTGDNTSALIVARHGKIFATGSATEPIIFTSESDDVNDPDDLTVEDRGLWGGIIILGNAKINTTSGVGQIEGIASNEPRGAYGGTNDDDNSGIFRYVSIRHGGSEIGAGNEINGLTMGAVGRGTTIEYVEVLSNLDDGYEWFGGTVNTKYLIAAFCADDAFDFDEGWTGKNQFWFALQGSDFAGRIAEQDGGTVPEDGLPFAIPIIRNATYIGPGTTAAPQGDGGEAMIFRDNAGGKYYNSIITEYNGATNGRAVFVEDLTSGADSRERLETGDLLLSNNIWWNFGLGNDVNTIVPQDFVRTHFQANSNQIVDPQLRSISRTTNNGLDPRPSATGPAATGASTTTDPYFANVAYYGAFNPVGPVWLDGWSALSNYKFITGVSEVVSGVPTSYSLQQNYPNPFNPSTVISYSVLQSGNVSLKVYDMLGREVATLVDGYQDAGSYRVQFDAKGLSTGIYLYRISAGNFHQVRKMLLTK